MYVIKIIEHGGIYRVLETRFKLLKKLRLLDFYNHFYVKNNWLKLLRFQMKNYFTDLWLLNLKF